MGEFMAEHTGIARDPSEGDSLLEVAVAILKEPTADVKARWTHIAAELWRKGHLVAPGLNLDTNTQPCTSFRPPDKPARDTQVHPDPFPPPTPPTSPARAPPHLQFHAR